MKSIVRLFAALAATLLLSLSIHAQTHEGHLPQTDGVIKKIDATAGKVTIAHGAIANLDMPAMTMAFVARDAGMLKSLKVGDKVRFRVADVKGVLTLVSIDPVK